MCGALRFIYVKLESCFYEPEMSRADVDKWSVLCSGRAEKTRRNHTGTDTDHVRRYGSRTITTHPASPKTNQIELCTCRHPPNPSHRQLALVFGMVKRRPSFCYHQGKHLPVGTPRRGIKPPIWGTDTSCLFSCRPPFSDTWSPLRIRTHTNTRDPRRMELTCQTSHPRLQDLIHHQEPMKPQLQHPIGLIYPSSWRTSRSINNWVSIGLLILMVISKYFFFPPLSLTPNSSLTLPFFFFRRVCRTDTSTITPPNDDRFWRTASWSPSGLSTVGSSACLKDLFHSSFRTKLYDYIFESSVPKKDWNLWSCPSGACLPHCLPLATSLCFRPIGISKTDYGKLYVKVFLVITYFFSPIRTLRSRSFIQRAQWTNFDQFFIIFAGSLFAHPTWLPTPNEPLELFGLV